MRELKDEEVEMISGGNSYFGGVLSLYGAYSFGQFLGGQFNTAFQTTTGMSVGEYIYEKLN